MEEMRKQFEKWINDKSKYDATRDFILAKFDNGKYQLSRTEDRWEAWKSSRAALVVDLSDMHLLQCDQNDVTKALSIAGITVKGE